MNQACCVATRSRGCLFRVMACMIPLSIGGVIIVVADLHYLDLDAW